MSRFTGRWTNRLKIAVLLGLALYFAYIYLSGKWAYYIDPRFQWLSVVAVLLLTLLALSFLGGNAEAHDHDHEHHDHDHPHDHAHAGHGHSHGSVWPVLVVAIPLVLGLAIPAKPLGANAIKTRGIDTDFNSITLSEASSSSLSIIPGERNVLDWNRAIASSPDSSEVIGQEADVVGFVYRDSRFGENQFMVARFTLTCCVADALAIGLVVQNSEAVNFSTDAWVKVKGSFQEVEFDGVLIPVIFAEEIMPTDQPEQPYLYQ